MFTNALIIFFFPSANSTGVAKVSDYESIALHSNALAYRMLGHVLNKKFIIRFEFPKKDLILHQLVSIIQCHRFNAMSGCSCSGGHVFNTCGKIVRFLTINADWYYIEVHLCFLKEFLKISKDVMRNSSLSLQSVVKVESKVQGHLISSDEVYITLFLVEFIYYVIMYSSMIIFHVQMYMVSKRKGRRNRH